MQLPTLDEGLRFAKHAGIMVNVEMKTLPRMYSGLAEAVVGLIVSMQMEDRVLISSFDPHPGGSLESRVADLFGPRPIPSGIW